MAEYEIEMRDDGTVDKVTADGRAFGYDYDDLDDAMDAIRQADGIEIEVTLIAPDGYRTYPRT